MNPSKCTKNCQCCLNSYSPYVIGEESEWWNSQSIVPIYKDGKILPPQGFCTSCNPKSSGYIKTLKCHAKTT